MARLPISRVVDVSVTREDRFPTRAGFGTPLILTSVVDGEGPIDANTRTKLYSSMEEVAVDWDSDDEAYKAALAVFSQNPRPLTLKIGFIDPDTLVGLPNPSVDIQDELDAVHAQDNQWYWLLFTKEFRSPNGANNLSAIEDAIIAWAEAKPIQVFLDTNDPLLEDRNDTTNVAARNKNGAFERTSIFYHTNTDHYLAAAAAGYTATRNFDQAETAYTANFKRLATITDLNKSSSVVQAITGFVPALGLNTQEGHRANTYVEIGGLQMLKEGSTLLAFIDEIHASDWLVARTQEEVLATLTNNARVPYTDPGIHLLVSACERVMQRAFIAGFLSVDEDENGDLVPAYEFEVERVSAVPASQRRQRIAPDIRGRFTYAGAVHFVTVRLTMQF